MKQYFVYILSSSKNGTLYIGMTNNLPRRINEHKQGLVYGFTKKYNVKDLVYYESYSSPYEALQREKRLKSWQRGWKIKLIEENNINWDDLKLS